MPRPGSERSKSGTGQAKVSPILVNAAGILLNASGIASVLLCHWVITGLILSAIGVALSLISIIMRQ